MPGLFDLMGPGMNAPPMPGGMMPLMSGDTSDPMMSGQSNMGFPASMSIPTQRPSILGRIRGLLGNVGNRANNLFPLDPTTSGMLSPEQQRFLQKQALFKFGTGLLAGSGPHPQGTTDAGSIVGQAASGVNMPEMQTSMVQQAMGLQQLQRTLAGRQQINEIMTKYPTVSGETDNDRRVRWGKIMQDLAATGTPEALQFIDHVGPTLKDLIGLDPAQALAKKKYEDDVDAERQSYDLLKKAGQIAPGEDFKAGGKYTQRWDQFNQPTTVEKDQGAGMPKVRETTTKGGKVINREVIPNSESAPPPAWTSAASAGASAVASWKDVEQLRQNNPGVEKELADVLASDKYAKAIPMMGINRAEAIKLLQSAAMSEAAKSMLNAKLAFLDNILGSKTPSGRVGAPLMEMYKGVLMPGVQGGFGQMRKSELREIISARNRAGFSANPRWWNESLQQQGIDPAGFDPLKEIAGDHLLERARAKF